jgi:hypothetical protein
MPGPVGTIENRGGKLVSSLRGGHHLEGKTFLITIREPGRAAHFIFL